MNIRSLRIDGVRNLSEVEIEPGPALNLFLGENGAGKTSILESLQCLATGRSFRSGAPLAWLNREVARAVIFAQVEDHRLGLEQTREGWEGRLDGQTIRSRAELSERLPYFVFHPESHALIEGTPEGRRRLVDHGVFHVEHAFLETWRRYRRALSQRNAALKQGAGVEELKLWEGAMVEPATALTGMRNAYVADLGAKLAAMVADIGARVPALGLSWYPGWSRDMELAEALAQARGTDRERGYTSVGPQRGDLRVRDEAGLVAGRISRGQQKVIAACLLFAQARLFEDRVERVPVFAMDDVGSELDRDHEARLGTWLQQQNWQVWLTGLEAPRWLGEGDGSRMFHVEQGRVTAVI